MARSLPGEGDPGPERRGGERRVRGGRREGSPRLARGAGRGRTSGQAGRARSAGKRGEDRRSPRGPCAQLLAGRRLWPQRPPPYSRRGSVGLGGSLRGELRPDHQWGAPRAGGGQERGWRRADRPRLETPQVQLGRAREPLSPAGPPLRRPSLQSLQP